MSWWYDLPWIGKALIALVVIVGMLFLALYIGGMLCGLVRRPLVEFCLRRKLKHSPWFLLIYEGIFVAEWFYRAGEEFYMELQGKLSVLSILPYNWLLIILIAIPIIVLLITTRVVYFIPVVLIKLLLIPLDIIYLVIAIVYRDDSEMLADISPSDFESSYGSSRYPSTGGGGGRRTSGGTPIYRQTDTHSGGRQTEESPVYISREHESYQPQSDYATDNYSDQYRTRTESGGEYHTTQLDGSTVTYSGDYAPFGADGPSGTYDLASSCLYAIYPKTGEVFRVSRVFKMKIKERVPRKRWKAWDFFSILTAECITKMSLYAKKQPVVNCRLLFG